MNKVNIDVIRKSGNPVHFNNVETGDYGIDSDTKILTIVCYEKTYIFNSDDWCNLVIIPQEE